MCLREDGIKTGPLYIGGSRDLDQGERDSLNDFVPAESLLWMLRRSMDPFT